MGEAQDQARQWRRAAEDYRALAEETLNPMGRETFVRLADTYAALAERLEAQVERTRAKVG